MKTKYLILSAAAIFSAIIFSIGSGIGYNRGTLDAGLELSEGHYYQLKSIKTHIGEMTPDKTELVDTLVRAAEGLKLLHKKEIDHRYIDFPLSFEEMWSRHVGIRTRDDVLESNASREKPKESKEPKGTGHLVEPDK